MQLQSPPTPDKPDAEPLLTPNEFRAIVARLERGTVRTAAITAFGLTIILTIGIISFLWGLWAGNSISIYSGLALYLAWRLTQHLHDRHIRLAERDIERLIEFVASTQDVNLLGPILDLGATWGHPGNFHARIRPAIHGAVVRLLPLVQADHADALNTSQRERLRLYLFRSGSFAGNDNWRSSDCCLEVLRVLEQIGDKRELPAVERLLRDEFSTNEVRVAAERCAQTIRERVAREEGKDILLRADRKPEAVETLLRPSAENTDNQPQQLLRAATHDDGNTPA